MLLNKINIFHFSIFNFYLYFNKMVVSKIIPLYFLNDVFTIYLYLNQFTQHYFALFMKFGVNKIIKISTTLKIAIKIFYTQ